MANPTFNNFSLQDSNYLTEEIEYRTFPTRMLNVKQIARRPGTKLLGAEYAEKRIRLIGHVIGSSSSDLITKIDNLHKNLAVKEGELIVETNRTYHATVSSLSIADPHYSQTYVPFEAEFVASDPFAYSPMFTLQGTVASGTSNGTFPVTISGSVFAEPTLTINFNGRPAGNTTVSGMVLDHMTAGPSRITVSGTIPFSSDFITTWSGLNITVSGNNRDFVGAFQRWEPGSHLMRMIVTSGNNPGFAWTFRWQERYY